MPGVAPRSSAASATNFDLRQMQRRIGVIVLFAILLGSAAAIGYEQLRYESFPAFLQAHCRTVTAGRDARISKILAEEGKWVETGSPLFMLDDSALDQAVAEKDREIAALEAELHQGQSTMELELVWRQRSLRQEILETKLKRANYLEREFGQQLETIACDDILQQLDAETEPDGVEVASIAPLTLRKSDSTEHARFAETVARRERSRKSSELAGKNRELCDKQLEELQRLQTELPARVAESTGVTIIRNKLQLARNDRHALVEQRQTLVVNAPATGLVGVLKFDEGDFVCAHEPLLQLLDEDRPYLLLRIPSNRVADFPPGTPLQLRFPGNKILQGRVLEIPPQTTTLPGDTSTTPDIIAHVEPAGALWPTVPFGTQIEVLRRR